MSTSTTPTPAHTEAWRPGPYTTQFYTRKYTPPADVPTRAAIVFVHGFAEHIARYDHFHPLLAAKGFAVFAYDQRGFGLTAQDTKGNKSKTSAYGKTCWKEQMQDVEWAINEGRKAFPGVPIILMGHSMGGAEVLGFATQGEKGPHRSTLAQVKAVIATSPLIHQTKPASKVVRWVGSKVGLLAPNALIAAPVGAEALSRDPAVYEAYIKDPLVQQQGSLRHLSDMLSKGESLLQTTYKDWPKELPVLIVHGSADAVTCPKASQSFHDKIEATKKKYSSFDGGYHELQNEPGDVKEKLLDEIVSFINEHVPAPHPARKTPMPTGPGVCTEGRTDVMPAPSEDAGVKDKEIQDGSDDGPKAKM